MGTLQIVLNVDHCFDAQGDDINAKETFISDKLHFADEVVVTNDD